MNFYPRTLKSEWYMANVCDTIFTALEAVKNHTSLYYSNAAERQAYLETFKVCQEIVKENDLHPETMLKALSDWHDIVITMNCQPYISWTRWVRDVPGARDTAMRVAFQLVDSISSRYLW